MSKMKPVPGFFMMIMMVFCGLSTDACSVCKVTINGRTWFGNNEDSWRLGSKIWFENGSFGKMGAVYFGYGDDFPQGGMNEAGLAYDGLTTLPKQIKSNNSKPEIIDPREFVKTIMQTCSTVGDVRKFAEQFNRQKYFNHGEFFFADKSGNYLIMESDTIITGNDDKYVIANFCPSISTEKEKESFGRYVRGRSYISKHNGLEGFDYTKNLTDTMHECRNRIGDGTMYSFVADLQDQNIDLYFYHDFSKTIHFNLANELAKGDHSLHMARLFPANKEYAKLLNYRTPQNSEMMLKLLFFSGIFLGFTALYFFISFFRRINSSGITVSFRNFKLLTTVLAVSLAAFFYVLIRTQAIFFSGPPYKDPANPLISLLAFTPFLLVLIIALFGSNLYAIYTRSGWHTVTKVVFTLNLILCCAVAAVFFYWGFYNIF